MLEREPVQPFGQRHVNYKRIGTLFRRHQNVGAGSHGQLDVRSNIAESRSRRDDDGFGTRGESRFPFVATEGTQHAVPIARTKYLGNAFAELACTENGHSQHYCCTSVNYFRYALDPGHD